MTIDGLIVDVPGKTGSIRTGYASGQPLIDVGNHLNYASSYSITTISAPDLLTTNELFTAQFDTDINTAELFGLSSVYCVYGFWYREVNLLEFKVLLRCSPPISGDPGSFGYKSIAKMGPPGFCSFGGGNPSDVMGWASYQPSDNLAPGTIYDPNTKPYVRSAKVYANSAAPGFVLELDYYALPGLTWEDVGEMDWVITAMASIS